MIYELKQTQVENQLKNLNEQILFFDNVINESPEITNVNLKPILQELKAEKESLEERLENIKDDFDSTYLGVNFNRDYFLNKKSA
ncbi:MAG: hypothetical protein VX341_10485 [Bdellovibrionota bacterium]|nr:hypothetical protein [Bdellovibrionota bacterium]